MFHKFLSQIQNFLNKLVSIFLNIPKSEVCPQPVFGILYECPIEEREAIVSSRSALHGHEVGLNGPQDIHGSFIDIPLGVPRTSFPGLGPPVTGGRRRFPSEGLRQVLVQTSILFYEVAPISPDFSECLPSSTRGRRSGLSLFFFSSRPGDPLFFFRGVPSILVYFSGHPLTQG
jgi:hypothetical protein